MSSQGCGPSKPADVGRFGQVRTMTRPGPEVVENTPNFGLSLVQAPDQHPVAMCPSMDPTPGINWKGWRGRGAGKSIPVGIAVVDCRTPLACLLCLRFPFIFASPGFVLGYHLCGHFGSLASDKRDVTQTVNQHSPPRGKQTGYPASLTLIT